MLLRELQIQAQAEADMVELELATVETVVQELSFFDTQTLAQLQLAQV
jgi:hypothetical protein